MIEGLVSMVKKGAKRHAKAIEKKKIKDTSATDEVSLPYIDDISPRELKAAEVMVKEEVRHFFFNAGPSFLSLVPRIRSIVR